MQTATNHSSAHVLTTTHSNTATTTPITYKNTFPHNHNHNHFGHNMPIFANTKTLQPRVPLKVTIFENSPPKHLSSQTPCLWSSSNIEPDDVDYGALVPLCDCASNQTGSYFSKTLPVKSRQYAASSTLQKNLAASVFCNFYLL